MTPPDPNEWLEGALRDDEDLADDGFTARVMSALPPSRPHSARVRPRPRWTYALPPAFAAAGCAACWAFAAQGHLASLGGLTAMLALFAMASVGGVTMSRE